MTSLPQAVADPVLAAGDPDLADGVGVDDDRGVGGALLHRLPLQALQHRAAPLLHAPHPRFLLRLQHTGTDDDDAMVLNSGLLNLTNEKDFICIQIKKPGF